MNRRILLLSAMTVSMALQARAADDRKAPWVRHVIAEKFFNLTASAADFTGDGLVDVIASGGEPGEDVLFVAPQWKRVVLRTQPAAIHSVALDVDGDGDPDFVGAQYSPAFLYWLERPARPLSDPWPLHVIDDTRKGGVNGIHGLILGDVNRDGKLDLVANSAQPGGNFPESLAWYAAPRFERHIFADRDAPGLSHYLGFGDVNGDGRPDLASAAKVGNWFAWWEAPADPTRAWKKHLVAEQQEGATNILMADVNRDGKTDFIASRGHGKGVVWYEAPSWTPHEMDAALVGPHTLAVGDIDGDGDSDAATCAKDSKVLAWFENDGKGRFTTRRIYEDQAAYDISLVDMDKDGDPDILVAGQDSKNVVWYENQMKRK
jgi:FG-GAP-like repeat